MIGQQILHYKIIEKLGEGGMGIVYLAEDTKLERQVAIKFLPGHIAANSDERRRFEIEAKAAAALNHPNIATIHAIEETEDSVTKNKESFLVMEYISGKHLKDAINDPSISPLAKGGVRGVVDIAIQIAKGLASAHKKGIVHRDIKSANIMSNLDNQVKIMDFGLAKFRGSVQITQIGTTVGTAAYMSPEQARGEDADKRSDIWSFGVVFYEMLSGRLPFKGEYEQAVLYSMLNEQPDRLTELNPDISPALASIVSRCLEKDIEKRYHDISDILIDLEKIKTGKTENIDTATSSAKGIKKPFFIYTAASLIALVLLLFFFLPDDPKKSPDNANQSELEKLAILPFSNLRPDTDTDYLGYALADQVIGAMSYVKNILVKPSSTIRKYTGQAIDIAIVGDELNVGYLLTGNYLKQGDIVRLNVELVNIQSGDIVWREAIEEKYENSFKLQDIISEKIISGLEIQFSANEKVLTSADVPANALAYEYYLRAVAYKDNSEGNQLAIEMLEKALTLDSLYAPSWHELGWRNHHFALYGLDAGELYYKAIQDYKKAIALNPNYIRSMVGLATLYTEIDNKDEALKISRKMLSINPNNPDVHFLLGYIYRYVGMNDEAKKAFSKAVNMNPDPAYRSAGHVYLSTGEYEKAVEYYYLDKDNPFYYGNAGYAYLKMAEFDKAVALLNKSIELDPNSTSSYYSLSCLAYLNGDIEKASEYLQLIENQNLKDGEFWSALADQYGLYKKEPQAIRTLRKAVELGYYNYPSFLNNSNFDSLRDNAEFQKVMTIAREKHEAFKVKYFPDSNKN